MVVHSFYIAEDEGFGVSESEFSLNENYFHAEEYYEELSGQFSDDFEVELNF